MSRRTVRSVLMYMLGRQSVSSATPDCPWQGPSAVPDCPWVESSCLHCRANMDSPAAKKARRQSGANSITSAPAAGCTEGALDEMPTAAGSPAAKGAAEEVLPGEGAAPLNMLTLHRWSYIRSCGWYLILPVCIRFCMMLPTACTRRCLQQHGCQDLHWQGAHAGLPLAP